jgi:organic hydroperoxide reductase OsmC/OhrA
LVELALGSPRSSGPHVDSSPRSESTDAARQRIVAAAHQVCPYSNATRGNIDVTLTTNGHDLG